MDERRGDQQDTGGDEPRRPYGRREYDRPPPSRSPPRRGRRRYDLPDDGTGREAPGGTGGRFRALRLGIGGGVFLLVAAIAVGLMLWRHGRHLRADGQARAQALQAGPHLFVARVGLGPNTRDVTFPADVRGF